ncbi:MAG: hypothetical protein OQK81_02290 [Candidatus Bathyarchaeota archaeon]|nr:hypothetical protein [Candidatus Bathyarchaeota archaeon]
MNGKKLALILGLVALVITIPAGYVLAHPGGYYYDEVRAEQYHDEEWWQEMRQYMEDHWDEQVDDERWGEMRAHMEERWEDVRDEDWYQEMEQYMEERWENQENYGRYGYSGFGGCHRGGW